MTEVSLTVLVLGYGKPEEARECLTSLRLHIQVPSKIIYQENGAPEQSHAWVLYQNGLCDVLVTKRAGGGGGVGQTDLWRMCDTTYALFVQEDQTLRYDITPSIFLSMTSALDSGDYACVDLNGDQSSRGVWTDRAHLMKASVFNGLGPFPNGGPGNDAVPWNEAYLQCVFATRGLKIAHVTPAFFTDQGKWSIREAGDGLFKHRCDTKQMWVLKRPTRRTEVYPPLSDSEWERVLAGNWSDGDIPLAWREHSFRHWA